MKEEGVLLSSPEAGRDQQRVLRDLVTEYTQQVHQILEAGPLLKGSVYQIQTRCGNPACHCAKPHGRRHAATVLSWSEAGRNHMRSIPPEERARVRHLAAQYRQLRQARAAVGRLHRHILRAIDALEKGLRLPPPVGATRRPRG